MVDRPVLARNSTYSPELISGRLARPVMLLGLVALTAKAYLIDYYLNHDSAWLLIAAERMLDGGSYSEDFYEVNPPLALLLHAPAVVFAGLAGIGAQSAYVGFVIVLVLASCGMLRAIGHPPDGDAGVVWEWLPLSAAAALLLFPGFDFGQREHLIVIFVLPYIILQAVVAAGGRPKAGTIVGVTLWACLGLFLKPLYLLFPVAIALGRAAGRRSLRPLFAADMLTIGATGLAYTAVVLLAFGDYFEVARAALDYYGAYRSGSILVYVVPLPYLLILLAPIRFFVHLKGTEGERSLLRSLALFGAVSAIVLLSQQKGWTYHQLPLRLATELSVLFVVAMVARRVHIVAAGTFRRRASVLVPAVVAALLVLSGINDPFLTSPRDLAREPLYPVLAKHAKGKSFYVFDTSVERGLEWVAPLGVRWASRFSCLWPLPGYVAALDARNPEVEADHGMADLVRRYVEEDFERFEPAVVLVNRRSYKQGFRMRSFEFLDFFLASERFSAIWRNYVYMDRVDDMDIYIRMAEGAVRSTRDED